MSELRAIFSVVGVVGVESKAAGVDSWFSFHLARAKVEEEMLVCWVCSFRW